MKIALDCDGVIYEWDKTARYMMRTYKGYGAWALEESSYWESIQDHVSKEDWDWLWEEGVRLGLFRYGHLVQGAVIGMKALVEAGHKLVVVTSRPVAAVPDTLAWLNLIQKPEAGVKFSGIHIHTDEEPKSAVRADILIDDNIDNVVEWRATGRRAILFSRTWNETYPNARSLRNIKRCKGWPEVVDTVLRWEKRYG